jgi:AraC-like DNA-binding protein
MNLIMPLDLGPHSFFLSYRNETRNRHWKMFHAHQGLELLYVHEGSGTVIVERSTYRLRSGMLFIFQPYQLHKVEVPPQGEASYIRTNVTFDPRMAEPYVAPYPKLHAFLRRLWKGSLAQQAFVLEDGGQLQQLLAGFEQVRSRMPEGPQEEERALFLLALLRHLQLQVVPESESGDVREKASRHIERIHDWIETHYREPFELEKMARQLHLSPYHVSHLFKSHTGMTLSDFIAVRRVREACALLANTDKPVGDIAQDVGGLGASYFCQLFKKHKGVTPQTYRATVRRAYE